MPEKPAPDKSAPAKPELPTTVSRPARDPSISTTIPAPAPASGDRTQTLPNKFAPVPGLPEVPGYAVAREVARGGMGTVFAAHDPTFGRDVAIKVMHFGQDAERFVVESRITAQLPHPGVPPVYTLGRLADGRPFLAMKLIQGRTLGDELKAATPADLPRLLSVFEAICQTVGFAHSRGIVHRDLKPANVMVGSFGEVLVMDWGLAKSGDRNQGPGDRNQESGGRTDTASFVAPRGDAFAFTATTVGVVKGTPAYMAPEQARGEEIDARADVFALGGILAAVLTGSPPFKGDTAWDCVQRAAQADLGECFAQLEACGADVELVAIARQCLAPDADDRYANGEAVAGAVAEYRAGVEERLRAAERARAVSAAEAREQRKRSRVQLGLAVALFLLLGGLGAFAWWQNKQRAERTLADERARAEQQRIEAEGKARLDAEHEFKVRQARDGIRAGLQLATDLRKEYKFDAADAALAQAEKLAASAPERLAEVRQARADLAFVVQLDDIRFRKWGWLAVAGGTGRANATTAQGRFSTQTAPPAYRQAFAARGLDLAALDPAEAAKRIAASAVKADLVAAVDDWALYEPDASVRDRLLTIARKADSDPWRDRLRDPRGRGDRATVSALAAEVNVAAHAPAVLCVLAELLRVHDRDPSELLARARVRYPADFELAFVLGHIQAVKPDGQPIGPYEAARARRPENPVVWNNLGGVLQAKGDFIGAAAAFARAVELDRNYAIAHYNLGTAREATGDGPGALAAYRRAVELDPNDPIAHYNLGGVLFQTGDIAGAIAALRRAIALDPEFSQAHNNLGSALHARGDIDGAIVSLKRAIELDSRDALAHFNLGNALRAKGNTAGTIAAYQRAIELDPQHALAHSNLSATYYLSKKYSEAIASARAALKINPKLANAHVVLGLSLQETGDLPGARAALTEAARLDKRWASLLAKLPPLEVAPAPREVKP